MRLISSRRMTSALRQRTEFGHQFAGGRIDHLEADDFGRLQVRAPLNAHEFGVADRREDDAEERLADARDARATAGLPALTWRCSFIVVRGRDLRHQHDVWRALLAVCRSRRAPFRLPRRSISWKPDGLFEVRMHQMGLPSYPIEIPPVNKVLASGRRGGRAHPGRRDNYDGAASACAASPKRSSPRCAPRGTRGAHRHQQQRRRGTISASARCSGRARSVR